MWIPADRAYLLNLVELLEFSHLPEAGGMDVVGHLVEADLDDP